MKYKIGDGIKDKKTKPIGHDDFIILATFTSDECEGYIIFNLYTNEIFAQHTDWEKKTKFSQKRHESKGICMLHRGKLDRIIRQGKVKLTNLIVKE